MNFGTILISVTKSCVSLMLEHNESKSKHVAGEFIRYVQLKEPLRKQFNVYHQLNSSYIKDRASARLFVSETLSTLDGISFDDILTYNHLLESKFNVSKARSTDIDFAISKLIKYRTLKEKVDQFGYVDSFNTVVNHISTMRNQDNHLSALGENVANSNLKFLQPKHIVRIAIKKFNDTYASNFDSEDRIVFNTLKEGDQKKINDLYESKAKALVRISNSSDKFLGEDLSTKVASAVNRITSGYTMGNLLDTHELLSELRVLRENNNG